MYVKMFTYKRVRLYVCAHGAYTYICVCTYEYTYICICIYKHIHICICS